MLDFTSKLYWKQFKKPYCHFGKFKGLGDHCHIRYSLPESHRYKECE